MHGEGRERRKVRKKVNKAQEKVNTWSEAF